MAGPTKKAAARKPPEKKGEAQKPQPQEDVLYSPEFLSSEETMIQAEQEMGKLEVS
jgi:hypothetical protein